MIFIDEEKYKYSFGIYGIKNIVNQKVYVGQTGENFQRRFWHHRWKLKDNTHDNQYLQNAWDKYGEDNFEYFVIEEVYDNELLDSCEIKWIDYYKQINKSYNMLLGGGGRRGFPMSEHAKEIIGYKNKINMTGTKHSKETKEKMSKARKGKRIYRKTDVLNEIIVKDIKNLLINGKSAAEISEVLNVDYKHINNLIANNTWESIRVDGWDEYRRNRNTYKRLTKDDHKQIYKLYYLYGYDKYQLSEMYGRTVKMIEKILRDDSNKSYDNPVPSSNAC